MIDELKTIRINKELHRRLKIFCSENDFKINFILEKIILDFFEKNKLNKDDNNRNSKT